MPIFAGICILAFYGFKITNTQTLLALDTVYISKSFDSPSKSSEMAVNYSVQVSVPFISATVNQGLRDEFNKLIIRTYLGDEYVELPPKEAVESYIKDEIEHLKKHDKISTRNVYTKNIANALVVNDRIISFENFVAKNMGTLKQASNYTNFDFKSGRVLQLEDIFIKGYEEKLKQNIIRSLGATYYNKMHQKLSEYKLLSLEQHLVSPDNFRITNEGISFQYDLPDWFEQTIGEVDITIPYKKLSELLNDKYSLI